MNSEKMFEIATRTKMRFPFRGQISVEDLWDLSTKNLDSIFKSLNSQMQQTKEESLLDSKTEKDEFLETQIEIIKYIVKTKLNENALKIQEKEKKEKKQKLMVILSAKQDEDLQNKSVDEIKAMLDELE